MSLGPQVTWPELSQFQYHLQQLASAASYAASLQGLSSNWLPCSPTVQRLQELQVFFNPHWIDQFEPCVSHISLGLTRSPEGGYQKVVTPLEPTPTTFSGGSWSPRVYLYAFMHVCMGFHTRQSTCVVAQLTFIIL